MKIAVQNPLFIFADQERNFNGYNFSFLKNHAQYIYLSRPWEYNKYKTRLNHLGLSNVQIKFTSRNLDVLIHFDGLPYHRYRKPSSKFSGLKIWHTMDYVFHASEASESLYNSGVDFLMGYANHDRLCPFFQKYYAKFTNRVISVPFGFGERFQYLKSFEKRSNLCLAAGSVNPVNDPECSPESLEEYRLFYKEQQWTHKFRRKLAENSQELEPLITSLLPIFPQTKNPAYDPVFELNQHKFFVNDEGLLNFPPARTYEGIASGAIMVANRNAIYDELGFKNRHNCLYFEKDDISSFEKVLSEASANLDEMKVIQENSLKLSSNYTHDKVAESLYHNVSEKYYGKS